MRITRAYKVRDHKEVICNSFEKDPNWDKRYGHDAVVTAWKDGDKFFCSRCGTTDHTPIKENK